MGRLRRLLFTIVYNSLTYKVRVSTQPLATDNYKNYRNRDEQTDWGAIGANMTDTVSMMINTANADDGRVSDTLHAHSRINCIKHAIKAIGDAGVNLAGFIRLDCCWHGKKDYEYSMSPVGNDFGFFYCHQGLLGLAPYKPTVNTLRMLHDDSAMFLMLYNSIRRSPGFGIPTIVKAEQKAVDYYMSIPEYVERVKNAEASFQTERGNGKDKMVVAAALAQYALRTYLIVD